MIKIPKEKYDFHIYGLKRGGHHAIINWILKHYKSSIYYNNCIFEKNDFYVANNNEIFKTGSHPYCVKVLSFEDRPNIDESSIEIISKNDKPKKILLFLEMPTTITHLDLRKKFILIKKSGMKFGTIMMTLRYGKNMPKNL